MAECRDSTINNTNTQKESIVLGHNDTSEENKTEKAMETFLLEDSQGDNFPRSFKVLQNSLKEKNELNRFDYIVLLCHILMLESGFVVHGCEEYYYDTYSGFHYRRLLSTVTRLPANWKTSNIYRIRYVYPPHINNIYKLVFVVTGDDLIINAYVEGARGINYAIIIDPARYVISSAQMLINKFQDIGHLSLKFKTDISNPVRNDISRLNNTLGFCFEDLPREILWYIGSFLSCVHIKNLRSTSQYFKAVFTSIPQRNPRYGRCCPVCSRKPFTSEWRYFCNTISHFIFPLQAIR